MFKEDISKFWELYNKRAILEAIENSPNYNVMKYTFMHRSVIAELCVKLGIPITKYAYHDCDKMIMMLFHTDEELTKEHRDSQPHHDRSTTDEDVLTEMMLDWESARFTKPDKPLNALGTLQKWYPEMTDRMMPILAKYGMDKEVISNAITQEEYEKKAEKVTPLHILWDMVFYVKHIEEEQNQEERLYWWQIS